MDQKITDGQRVYVVVGDKKVPTGTIGTIQNLLTNDLVIIQYGFDGEKEKYAGVKIESIRPATLDEIIGVEDYRYLVNKNYHIGKRFRTEKGYKIAEHISEGQIVEIHEIHFNTNAKEDSYHLKLDGLDEIHEVTFTALSSPLFIEYNENIEQHLGEEVQGEGEYLDIRTGVRVKLKPPYKTDIIGVVTDIYDREATVRTFRNGVEEMLDVSLTKVYPATIEEIMNANPKEILDHKFSIGNMYDAKDSIANVFQFKNVIGPGDRIKTLKVEKFSQFVIDDVFVVMNVLTGKRLNVSTLDLYNYFDLIEEGVVEEMTNEIAIATEEKEVVKVKEILPLADFADNEDKVVIHSLSINGFQFDIEDNNIHTDVLITKENIELYIRSLNKLNTLIK